ncbi:MAG TPA: hypothetical protein VK390_01805, partial [Propionibacteriaceae bacterium]|nr:hypothetical protein [Propionibacteriaceae bacterium]
AFTTRDLSEYRIVYLFVDGIAERLRAGQAREPVLAAWGIGEEGGKVLGSSTSGCHADGLRRRSGLCLFYGDRNDLPGLGKGRRRGMSNSVSPT